MSHLRTSFVPFALLALVLTGGCRQKATEPPTNEAIEQEPGANLAEALPVPEPAMDRAGFLAAVAAAASAHTAGADDREAQAALDGRRFAIRIRFGCGGASAADSGEPLRWSAGKDGTSFEVRATPDLSLDSEQFEGTAGETIEAVEGFWLARPWLMNDACPAQRQDAPATAVSPSRLVGIAQYFTPEDSRVQRRGGRSYVSVEKIESVEQLPPSGLILALEGRFRSWPGGKVIRCQGSGISSQPQCVAAAHLDRAAFERPDGTELAEWRS